MNISLTPELERFVQQKVAGGLYTSASEVIRESLRLMHAYEDVQKQKLIALNQAIEEGLQQLEDRSLAINGESSRKKMKLKLERMSRTKK